MVYSYPYNEAYHGPAMPMVEITLVSTEDKNEKLILHAFVDSGADGTMIPVRYLRRLGAKVVDTRRMRGSDGISHPVDVYGVVLSAGPLEQLLVEVTGNRFSDEVIIGRDILNQMIVTLNGLAHVVELSF